MAVSAVPRELSVEVAASSQLMYPPSMSRWGVSPWEDTILTGLGGWSRLTEYDKLLRDARAFAALRYRTDQLIAHEYEVEPAENADSTDTRAAEKIAEQLKKMKYDIVTRCQLGAIVRGLSVGECMYREPSSQKEKDRLGPIQLFDVRFRRPWQFHYDRDARLKLIPRIGGAAIDVHKEHPRKFLDFVTLLDPTHGTRMHGQP